jgi:hypothetical protein
MNLATPDNLLPQPENQPPQEGASQTQPRPKHTRPPLPVDYKELCALCRAGKLFAVQDWFKKHRYCEPARYDSRHWPIGIAIEKGFHSLVEVLLQNGVPANARALQRAVEAHDRDIVELMFQYGATVNMVEFDYVVFSGNGEIIRMFIERGADLVTNYPITAGLIRQTRFFLGIYKSNIEQHPELQFQADMALRHFCDEGSLRGVSLLMWLGANPRAKVPNEAGESEAYWETSLMAAAWKGQLDVIKRLKPDPAKDDLNQLLFESIYCRNMDLVRYWISLGADKNHVNADGDSAHEKIISSLAFALDPRDQWFRGNDGYEAKRFTQEWFSSGVKWSPKDAGAGALRKALSRLSSMEAYDFIKLLLSQQVMSADELGEILDCPKLREHLKERQASLAALIPKLQKWVKAVERKRQLEQQRQVVNDRSSQRLPSPPRPYSESNEIGNNPRSIRRLSDE